MPKFVLIDHSIVGVGGHYYEYARHVLEAAEKAGYDPILVTNRRFRGHHSANWRVHALYKCGFWASLSRPIWCEHLVSAAKAMRNTYLRWRTKVAYSRLALFWYVRRRPGAFLRSQLLTAKVSVVWIPIIVVAVMLKCLLMVAAICRDMMPLRGYFSRMFGAASRMTTGVARLFRRVFSRSGLPWKFVVDRYRLGQFTKSTLRLTRLETISAGDLVLLPTVSELELAAISAVLRRRPLLSKARWNLIFRRNIFPGRQQIEFSASPDLTALRAVFQSCAGLQSQGTLAYFTDTDELTEQYRLTSGAPFDTLPIPHTQAPQADTNAAGPVCINYLGDARSEKGYQHLPRIVGDLWRDCIAPRKATFVIQSNYNIPRGETPAIVARSQLRRLASTNVTLLEEPLASDEYWKLIHSADVSLLPYDRDNYYARSSGILVESLAAGVPVLVPAGTWLSRQIIDEIYAHRMRLREQLPLVGTVTDDELKPRVEGCPKAIVRKGDEWWICGGLRWTTCRLHAPGSSLMLLSLSMKESSRGDLLDVRVKQYAANRLLVANSLHCLERHRGSCRASLLVPVNSRTDELRVSFRNAVDERRLVVSAPQIDFLSVAAERERVPTGSVGLVYRSIEDVPHLLREMVALRQHYLRTARDFADQWLRCHNAANFVDTLRRASGSIECTKLDIGESHQVESLRRAA